MYKLAANKVNNNPSEQQFLEEKIIRLKEFKKICKTKQKDFWNSRSKELGQNNDRKFWDIWKKSDENITIKSHDSVDGEKWENFYSNLFKNHNVENSKLEQENSQVSKNRKKISNHHLLYINKLTNFAELKRILKLLKSGKSPGVDRISNEMLRYSFPILKHCFVKLFNLVLKAGDAPEIWCKGLISPVHKKGDPTNPDNYRPICVLSCLCKFFTNMLNSRLVEVCKKEKLIHVSQIGFKKRHRTTDHLFSLKTLINNSTIGAQRGHNKLYACFIDFKKAYDCVA